MHAGEVVLRSFEEEAAGGRAGLSHGSGDGRTVAARGLRGRCEGACVGVEG